MLNKYIVYPWGLGSCRPLPLEIVHSRTVTPAERPLDLRKFEDLCKSQTRLLDIHRLSVLWSKKPSEELRLIAALLKEPFLPKFVKNLFTHHVFLVSVYTTTLVREADTDIFWKTAQKVELFQNTATLCWTHTHIHTYTRSVDGRQEQCFMQSVVTQSHHSCPTWSSTENIRMNLFPNKTYLIWGDFVF